MSDGSVSTWPRRRQSYEFDSFILDIRLDCVVTVTTRLENIENASRNPYVYDVYTPRLIVYI